jgi:hypothetical protein
MALRADARHYNAWYVYLLSLPMSVSQTARGSHSGKCTLILRVCFYTGMALGHVI